MMDLYHFHHPAASSLSQHEDDHPHTGIAFQSHLVWGRIQKADHYQIKCSEQGKASPPASAKPHPAQLPGCSPL